MNNWETGNWEREERRYGGTPVRRYAWGWATAYPPVRPSALLVLVVALAGAVSSSCDNAGADRVLSIDATGEVVGLVYFDADGDRETSAGDTELSGVRVSLVNIGGTEPVANSTSDDLGVIQLSAVPVGNYQVVVDTATIGDSTIVAQIDSSEITVVPYDTQTVLVGISFPILTTREVLALPIGSKTFVDGIALTAGAVFGDSTLHVADTSGALRAVRVGVGPVSVGDSVRLRGAIASRDGRPVLDLNRRAPLVLAIAEVPAPDTLSTADAATALSGALDASIVRIDSARVVDTTTVGDDFIVTVDDGSGALEVVFDGNITFNSGPYLIPGADVGMNGVLVYSGGAWKLKPRDDSDVQVTPPVLAISEVRTVPVGQVVFLDGKVLTAMSVAAQTTVFGDSAIHVADTSGAIRITRVKPVNLAVGDSVRVVGTTAVMDGQVVVDQPTVFPLGFSFAPQPRTVTTAEAAGASGGALDAALVRIDSARISDTATVAGELVITVSDGSGALEIKIDDDITFTPGQYLLPGADIAVDGVLVPSGSAWQVKPRGNADMAITVPVISIADARGKNVGEIVFVDGTALNYVVPSVAGAPPRTAFRDTTIHVSDPAGAIRGKRIVVPGADLTAGDSVRLYGKIAIVDGQPVIDDTRLFRLDDRPELALSSALPLTTAEATTANGGTADAAFVGVSAATVADTATVGDDFHATVGDGSGLVVVVFDGDLNLDLSPYIPEAVLDVWGLLVADGVGTWVLKPRGANDVQP